ncbi:MAG TPA: sodium ion-translocating decarboxylase subunit beta [Candidatus Limadaptatus stercorigallinarum]|uniref:Sodium ion-translocating decarboxylase subunit beta n=1 Tax=Candidatus Limadaptatus stercorigallinarum TaxID=2840845 RepID=A0A9D1L178_9FIRM|nr:sodium ion-translocating decarboxylase subunit beta [Candidatus Limadaptatus stercorigallinarum]
MNFVSQIIGATGSNVDYGDTFAGLWESTGFFNMQWGNVVMIIIACFFLFLAIKFKFEPLLLVGIAFGMLLSNIPGPVSDWIYHPDLWVSSTTVDYGEVLQTGGLIDILYIGVKTSVYPCLIFLGVGAMTDFEPLLSNPKSLILGAAAQFGIYVAFFLAVCFGFSGEEAASIGIVGGADGPTAIWLTKALAPHLLAAIAIAAYSYMALIPVIQPPIMRLMTTKKERAIVMKPTRTVKKSEKILFPIVIIIATCLFLPSVAPLLGCLMLGNLLRECGVTARLSDTAQNALMNIVTICLSVSVGATAHFSTFLTTQTLLIVVLGLVAFAFATVGGLGIGKIMCWLSKGKINPLIGSAGVSAVPMAARVSNLEGLRAKPGNYLLMHAMGPNVAGVIGSAVAAGFFMAVFGG